MIFLKKILVKDIVSVMLHFSHAKNNYTHHIEAYQISITHISDLENQILKRK